MATTFPVLGQASPAASTPVKLISARASDAVVSTITVANRGTVSDSFYIRVAVADAAADNKQYVAYKVTLDSYSFVAISLGLSLASADTVYVSSDLGTCSFNAFGTVVG